MQFYDSNLKIMQFCMTDFFLVSFLLPLLIDCELYDEKMRSNELTSKASPLKLSLAGISHGLQPYLSRNALIRFEQAGEK
jgi:hypothetical protein